MLLFFPWLVDRNATIMPGLMARYNLPELRLPDPKDLRFSPPVIHLPAAPKLTLPILSTHPNMPIWLILGIAAFLLFVVGNFCLIFHNPSGTRK